MGVGGADGDGCADAAGHRIVREQVTMVAVLDGAENFTHRPPLLGPLEGGAVLRGCLFLPLPPLPQPAGDCLRDHYAADEAALDFNGRKDAAVALLGGCEGGNAVADRRRGDGEGKRVADDEAGDRRRAPLSAAVAVNSSVGPIGAVAGVVVRRVR